VGRPPEAVVAHIASHLRGFETDPFGAWMCRVLLAAALRDVLRASRVGLPTLVETGDALARHEPDGPLFDLVIGNPPYGRVSLDPARRCTYARSLYGHANLYGLFTDLALRWTKPGGIIAYVTPTSFLGGAYYRTLRGLLLAEAPPLELDFVADRKGVFDEVLQETLLATYRRGGRPDDVLVNFPSTQDDDGVAVQEIGVVPLPSQGEAPWLLPRSPDHLALVRRLARMPHRLADYGWTVSTGPLVWNRHKKQLRSAPEPGTLPLVWAESVQSDGRFVFKAEKRNHAPWFAPRGPADDWLIVRQPCVLVQRTTAKEQSRRLIAAVLPESFVAAHGGVVVENHLNIVRPNGAAPRLSAAALAALLNSTPVDTAFRCMNGSVAVSAAELEALPLPEPERIRVIEELVARSAPRSSIESAIARAYSAGSANVSAAAA
jgi:adenine-specific DNA-methyltransferase